ncbi:MAG: biopolymer transporter ExbD [Acidobacteria bacterium]|nr:biopolymer transporter ExbD [Acidobacteriota bacterium]
MMTFSMVYMGIILVTLIISGLVGPNWDLWYPKIRNPVARAARASKAYSDHGSILIGIDRNHKLYIDRRQITLGELRQLVREKWRLGGKRVYIKADEACSFGFVLEIMRSCKDVGAYEIRILVVRERQWPA